MRTGMIVPLLRLQKQMRLRNEEFRMKIKAQFLCGGKNKTQKLE